MHLLGSPRGRAPWNSCLVGLVSWGSICGALNTPNSLRCYYVASSPGSPIPHLLDGHRKLVGCSVSLFY